ncbi:MAG TPA: hypothetical protein VIN04_08145 [Myxococcota bacterium]
MIEHAFHEEQRRGHLQRERLVRGGICRRQLGGDQADDVEQAHEPVVAEVACGGLQRCRFPAQPRQAARVARHVVAPRLFHRGEPRAHAVEHGLELPHVVFERAREVVIGQLCVERVGRLDLRHARAIGCRQRETVEHLAHERRRVGSGAAVELAQQPLRAHEERLARRRLVHVGSRELDEPGRDPPHSDWSLELAGDAVERVERSAHHRAGLRIARFLQPADQAALELAARAAQKLSARCGVERSGGARTGRHDAKIGKEELGLGGVASSAELVELPVDREELERHVRLALREVVDVLREREERAVEERYRGLVELLRLPTERLERPLDAAADEGRAFEAQQLHRAADMTYGLRAAVERRARLGGVLAKRREGAPRLSERAVDLRLEPAEGRRDGDGLGGHGAC